MKVPTLFGVLNLSPDSTTKISVAQGEEQVLQRAALLRDKGADVIDIGARSTWEFAEILDDAAEWAELEPALRLLKGHGFAVSIDTWSPNTAIAAAGAEADVVNFVGSDYDEGMLNRLADSPCRFVMTWMPYVDPYAMRDAEPVRPTVAGIRHFFEEKLELTDRAGIRDVILDPNIGILHHSYKGREKVFLQAEVVAGMPEFAKLKRPLLIHSPRQDDENGRAIIASYILQQKPDCIRTHYPELIRELQEFAHA